MSEITGKDLYERIDARAKEVGFKDMTELCKTTGASRAALSDLNCGRTLRLSAKTMSKLAPALQVSADFFTTGECQNEKTATIDVVDDDLREYLEELRSRPEMRMLFSTTKTATKEQIEAIVKFIEGMRNE